MSTFSKALCSSRNVFWIKRVPLSQCRWKLLQKCKISTYDLRFLVCLMSTFLINATAGSSNCDYRCTSGGGCEVSFGGTLVQIFLTILTSCVFFNHIDKSPGFLFPARLWRQLQWNSKTMPGLQPSYQLLNSPVSVQFI